MKCSGDSNQALRVATAPSGSSLRDFDPFFFPLDPSSMIFFAFLTGINEALGSEGRAGAQEKGGERGVVGLGIPIHPFVLQTDLLQN